MANCVEFWKNLLLLDEWSVIVQYVFTYNLPHSDTSWVNLVEYLAQGTWNLCCSEIHVSYSVYELQAPNVLRLQTEMLCRTLNNPALLHFNDELYYSQAYLLGLDESWSKHIKSVYGMKMQLILTRLQDDDDDDDATKKPGCQLDHLDS